MDGLQNHPGEHEFPVRLRARYARVIARARRERWSLADRWRATVKILLVVALSLAGVAPLALPAIEAMDFPPMVIAAAVAIIVFAIAVVFVGFALLDAGVPRREQRKYRKLGGMVPLTDAQQRLLTLDALSDFTSGSWNSSLEYLPSAARLVGTGVGPDTFLSLRVVSRADAAKMLDDLIGAATEWQLRRVLEDLMKGDASAQLRAALRNPREERRLQRLGELTGHPFAYIRALGTPGQERPAPQLRGLDANRIVQSVRLGYMAGFLTETESWELLARVDQAVRAHFGSLGEYVENMRIAAAFMGDSPEVVADFDRVRDGLLASNWPAAGFLAEPDAADEPVDASAVRSS